MRKFKMLIGIRALGLVFGMIIAGCGGSPGDSDPDPFEATWLGTDVKLVAANGSWNQYRIPNNKEVQLGSTLTLSNGLVDEEPPTAKKGKNLPFLRVLGLANEPMHEDT
jgi:hypothetical protein